jgi:HAE1 family hydrophobic/amphiphilic exporter-1
MIFLGIILLGFISWTKLPQELFPSITYPQITVVTSYENAAPEEIESLVTKIIEEAVGTVNRVKRISSISKEGLSLVMVEFSWGTNMDFAALNVREKIDLIKEKLPREAQEPIVMKYNPFDLPIMNLAVTGKVSALELREICRKYIKDTIEKVEGVASTAITGGEEREILVEIDQPRLRASQISIVSVIDSVKAANLNYPAGTIKESFYEYLIRTMGEYQKVEEIKETPTALELPEEEAKTVKEKEKKEQKARRLVYLKDIAKVKDTVKEKNSISRYNGNDSVSLVIRKQSGTNTLNVVKGVKREIKKLLAEKLPKGIDIQITYDQSQFIQEAIGNVRDAAVQGAFLAFLVLFFFLWDLNSSLVITASILISVMATLCLMYFANINLNMMSLGGLALGVGMLVDNSIVVIENTFRHRYTLKKGLKEACIDATEEMISPILGSTLTTVAVFLPFAFVVGIAGQIFKQLSFTITFSLIASIIVAISLVPVMISIGRERHLRLPGYAFAQKINEAIMRDEKDETGFSYARFIDHMLLNKGKVILIITLAFILSLIILLKTERQFLPRVDQRQFIIKVDLSPGTRLEVTDSVVKKVEQLLLGLPETQDVTVNIGSTGEKTSTEGTAAIQTLGSHQAQLLVNLKKKSRRQKITRSTDEIIQYLKTNLEGKELEKAEIEYIAQETSLGSAIEQGAPVAIEIKGQNLNQLSEVSLLILSRIKEIRGVYGAKSSVSLPSPETKLNILKDKSSLYGLSVRDIAITAQAALKGYVATKFKEKTSEEDVDIRVRLRPEDRSDLNNLRRMLIHSPLGMEIPLSEVAYLTKGVGPTEIKRVDQQRSVIITANVFKRNFNQVAGEINNILNGLRSDKIMKNYSLELAGEQQRLKESFGSLAFALILAFILVYMIMAAEFESLWQPLLIMFTVPLSLIGVAVSLFITRTPLSVVAYLGIIMLGGIAVNNGIVLIEFVNGLRKEGFSPEEAVMEASKTRLRPILMTSLTTILGLLPLALGIGEGAELQAPLALTVMGGLTSATFLTLVFIPALYLVIVERIEKPALVLVEEAKVEAPLFEPEVSTIAQAEIILKEDETKSIRLKKESEETPVIPRPVKSEVSAVQELNPRQKGLIEKLKIIKKITRKDYAQTFGISIPTAARDLKELVDRKLLTPKGPFGPGRWYELTEEKNELT